MSSVVAYLKIQTFVDYCVYHKSKTRTDKSYKFGICEFEPQKLCKCYFQEYLLFYY